MKRKIQAATLVETLIAMTIIIVCFGIGMMIYLNVLNSDRPWQSLKTYTLLKEIAKVIKVERSYFDDIITMDDYEIHKTIEKHVINDHLIELRLELYDQKGKPLKTRNELIVVYE